ncbi:uncharacterized protein LOC114965636 isoform X2 [Acropora millepora]|uniref:uncharacterized protein LOC114965636 isoform X2 n=1 Tax=Acropora millepora TaxID=45264 RepID=UPI001CF4D011|nr:uncharacterized protein LOC114965636 isoform X2 [Acropora millepora]
MTSNRAERSRTRRFLACIAQCCRFGLIDTEIMSQDNVSQQAGKNFQTLNITLLGSEWKSSKGGLSTLNRELAIYLSQIQNVRVSLLIPEGACNDEDKRDAGSLGINILEAKNCVGLDSLVWLCCPPHDHTMDVIIGHSVKLGCQVQLVKRIAQFQNCKWVHVVHTSPEELSKFKDYDSPISKGEKKLWAEVELCKCADLIVTVGPKLREIYDSYLRRFKNDEDVFELIPGLFDREFGGLKLRAKNEKNRFEVLLCGRGDEEDFELKGYSTAVKAIDYLRRNKGKHYFLRFVGAPEEKQDEVWKKLLNCVKTPVDKELLTVRKFVKSREGMKDLFSGVDMVIMPSKSEGFGLVALEALSAGLPILVGSNSGFAKAIETIPFGKYCIVDSDDPAKWAAAIESVRIRHKVILEKIKQLKKNYRKTYCWKRQCEELVDRLQEMVCGTSTAQVVAVNDWVEKRPRIITESVCQQHIGAGSKRARKLGKRRILESKAEYGDLYTTPLFSEQNGLDQRTSMIGTATAADDKEVLGKPEEDTDQMARFTPWHKTEVHFNGLVQQCPPCLETVRTPVQFLRSFFRGCLDELANMIARLHEATISIRSLASCDADTFIYPPLSFRPNVVMRTPILQTLGTSTVQKCNTCYENSTVASSCLIYPREMFDRRTRRERCTRCDPKPEVVVFVLFGYLFFFFILFNGIVKQ